MKQCTPVQALLSLNFTQSIQSNPKQSFTINQNLAVTDLNNQMVHAFKYKIKL